MSVRNGIVLIVTLATVSLLVACGSSNSATAPPSGGLTTSSLSGTYVFSFSGTDVTNSTAPNTDSPFAAAGVLVASNGSFGSGSTVDINDPELATVVGASS